MLHLVSTSNLLLLAIGFALVVVNALATPRVARVVAGLFARTDRLARPREARLAARAPFLMRFR